MELSRQGSPNESSCRQGAHRGKWILRDCFPRGLRSGAARSGNRTFASNAANMAGAEIGIMPNSCKLQVDSALRFRRIEKTWLRGCKAQHGLRPFEDLPANGIQSFTLTSAEQFLIAIEANLRLLRMSALVMPLGRGLTF